MADDVVQIDIEVSTHASKEISSIINDIDKTEQKISSIKEKKRRQLLLRGGGAPSDVGFGEEEDERGGIFGGQLPGEAVPQKPRDVTSKEPVQRINRFKELEERQSNMEKALGLGKNIGGGLAFIKGGDDPIQKLFTALGRIPGFVQAIGIFLIAKGLFDFIIEELFRPGGLFDRRFLPKLKGVVSNLTDRREKAEINAGLRTVISTSSAGLRGGRGQFISTQSFARRTGLYDRKLEHIAKGVNL